MPTISMFYGILILMFFRDNRRHHLPHIHARYQGTEAAISIEDGGVLDGSLSSKQLKMVQAWIEIHKEAMKTKSSCVGPIGVNYHRLQAALDFQYKDNTLI